MGSTGVVELSRHYQLQQRQTFYDSLGTASPWIPVQSRVHDHPLEEVPPHAPRGIRRHTALEEAARSVDHDLRFEFQLVSFNRVVYPVVAWEPGEFSLLRTQTFDYFYYFTIQSQVAKVKWL